MKNYTRVQKLIRDTFIDLLRKKGFENISVKDVLESANVSKSGFYAHYEDKYHLMRSIEDELLDEVRKAFSAVRASSSGEALTYKNPEATNYYALYYKCLAENESMFRLLLSSKGSGEFFNRLTKSIMEEQTKTREVWGASKLIPEEYLDYYTTFYTYGYVGAFTKWVKDDREKRPPAESMGAAFSLLFTTPEDAVEP